jgi:glucose-1-phosphate thymidylyltransferase
VTLAEADTRLPRHAVLAELDGALDHGPVFLHPGDALFGERLHVMTDRYQAGGVDVVLPAETSVAGHDPRDGWLATTAMVLGPDTRPLVRELSEPAADGEDLIELLLHSDYRLAVTELAEQWAYEDSTDALLAGNRLVLDALRGGALDPGLSESNEFHGRVTVGRGVFMSGCVVHGPVSIGDRAVLEDSFIGPYTAIGRGVVLSGAEVENSIVLTDAEIRHPGQRIVSSIIGERARVTRSFELPQGMHLRLGPDSRITLS